MTDSRLEKLRTKLEERDLDAFLVSTAENRRYVSGFAGSAGYLVVSRDQAFLATDFRYTEQAAHQSPNFQVVKSGRDWSWLVELLNANPYRRIGFESQHLTVETYRQLSKSLKELPPKHRPTLVAAPGTVESLRTVKDEEELALLQKAIDVADAAMESVATTIVPGETEIQVAWRLEKAMRESGAESLSFDTIVAAGPNGAMPHHMPTDRPIAIGEPVVIDMGAKVNGYCSDITRTICVGEPDERFKATYDIVLGAQLTAIATVRAGMNGEQADNLSRVVINEAGYGENFGHSLGHGIGLEVHEYPGVGAKSNHVLQEGMVFSIEPGIYLSGWGGVRIEDLVLLGSDGAKVLSKATK